MRRPILLVTVDTEEEGLWSGSYRATGNTCHNIERLPAIHSIFTRLRVKPTYLVDYPVATDERACGILSQLTDGGQAEIGAHMHPWCTPPLQPVGTSAYYSYPHRSPPPVQLAKLRTLTSAIERAFGRRPTSHRAGRWGFDHTSVPALEQVGITVDASVQPLWWDPAPGGPKHARAPQRPYRLARTDACRAGASGVVEVPSNRVVVGPHGAAVEAVVRRARPAPGLRWLLRRLGLRSLSPELHTPSELCRVADTMAARALPVFDVTFHSTCALPGATPYVRDEAELRAFANRLSSLLEHLLSRHHALPLTLSDVPPYLGL